MCESCAVVVFGAVQEPFICARARAEQRDAADDDAAEPNFYCWLTNAIPRMPRDTRYVRVLVANDALYRNLL